MHQKDHVFDYFFLLDYLFIYEPLFLLTVPDYIEVRFVNDHFFKCVNPFVKKQNNKKQSACLIAFLKKW